MKLKSSRELEENGIIFIEEIYTDGERETVVRYKKRTESSDPEPTPDPEPTQLDRIEETVNALAADSVTVEKIEAAITEGVNEV